MILNKITLIETIYENLEVKDIDVATNIVDSLLGLGNLPTSVGILLVTTEEEVPRSNVGEEYIINLESLIDVGNADEVGMLLTSEYYSHTTQTENPQAPITPIVTHIDDSSVSIAVTVTDPNSHVMNVFFKSVADDGLIADVQNVASGGSAVGVLSGLVIGEEYSFYAQAIDSDGNESDCSNFFTFTMGTGAIEVLEIPPINLTNYTKKNMITADAGVGNYKFSFNRLEGTTEHFYRAYAIKDSVVKYGEIFSVLTIPESYVYEEKLADVEVGTNIITVNDLNVSVIVSDLLTKSIKLATPSKSSDSIDHLSIETAIKTLNRQQITIDCFTTDAGGVVV